MNKIIKEKVHQRMLWADVIRIIAIYLVVQTHTMSISIDKLSVPLFVMISGSLLLGKKESNLNFLKNEF